MRTLIRSLLALLIVYGIERFCYTMTGGFITSHTHINLPGDPTLPVQEPSAEVRHLLDQPYTYLGKGNEAFAFLSQDGTTVIKLFKLHSLRPAYFFQALHARGPFFAAWKAARIERLNRTLTSCHIAFNDLSAETGLLYLHFDKTTLFERPLLIYDKLGNPHTIDLNSTKFLLQRRADPLFTALIAKKEAEAKECIDSLIALILKRGHLGIEDRDPRLGANFGIIENRIVEIDTGSFSYNPLQSKPAAWLKELYFELAELETWLEKSRPELSKYLHERVHEEIDKFSKES